ncbi:MAG TPA: Asp-tRNA(Asn)/Glu-tRNA(Gln) amidotransferase subunit GatC [Verrucomicrobiales bacterium]|nr:Asp-tRNA(Asn)/Glu-tRNA(Gln) amidotransferase subunit GatC [Verrucomicrobiales bacterium]
MDVRYIADLARLELTEEEVQAYQGQLNRIVEYLEKLDSCDLAGVKMEMQGGGLRARLREDREGHCLTREEALGNAPSVADGQFRAPKVVE